MSSIRGERVRLGQADGREIELIVSGDEDYARYETPSGHAVIYDDKGVFVYARLVNGRFVSTAIPADQPPPAGMAIHQEESPQVRSERSAARRSARERR